MCASSFILMNIHGTCLFLAGQQTASMQCGRREEELDGPLATSSPAVVIFMTKDGDRQLTLLRSLAPEKYRRLEHCSAPDSSSVACSQMGGGHHKGRPYLHSDADFSDISRKPVVQHVPWDKHSSPLSCRMNSETEGKMKEKRSSGGWYQSLRSEEQA